ncbi:MAG: hypothetical protein ACE5NJ_08730 [Thermodesulfobacteriota bacterium]
MSDLLDVWGVDMFFKTGSGIPALVAAPGAEVRTFKSQRTGSANGEVHENKPLMSGKIEELEGMLAAR